MCGITGAIWTRADKAVDERALSRMTEALVHRGPDDQGYFTSDLMVRGAGASGATVPGVALGHRRLSIIDLAGSRQPLANEDDTIQLIFNGEIYNYRQLRKRLEGSGHRFRTAGDAETLVHLYEDEGDDFLEHVVGMFAFALWDARRQRLVLARDRLGQKPLVYRSEPGRLLFASEVKSLLALPDVPRTVDRSALDEYLTFQYVPHPNTIFEGIHKLPPAHMAIYETPVGADQPRLRVWQYWIPPIGQQSTAPEAEQAEALRAAMHEAVKLRLQSDVLLGAFLSGGVDSSVIVALMQQLSGQQIKTFSIGFPIAEYDETKYARRVAAHLGTDHHEFRVEPRAVDVLPKLVWHFDEPFADSSAIPTYYLAQITREHVTVALSGDGGDELFAGYPRYQAVRLAAAFDRFPRLLRRAVTSDLWQHLPASPRQKGVRRRWKRFTAAIGLSPQRRYAEWVTIFNLERRAALYTDEFLAHLDESDPVEFLLTAYGRWPQRDIVSATSLVDLVTYLPCDLMTKVDISSMAHSLECRQPFLDHRLVELAAVMPLAMKIRGRRGKHVLQRLFGDLLPREIFTRRKMGFGVPLDHWFRHDLYAMAHDVLLDRRAIDRGYFRRKAVCQLLDEHTRGAFDHAARLWSLLVLELWHREWIDG